MLAMKKLLVLAATVFVSATAAAETVTTVDVVRVIDGQIEETLYYYENNWTAHRVKARAAGAISGYRLLIDRETGDDVVLLLMTEYADPAQYEKREDNFAPIIEAAGGRKLLNDTPPGEFREITDSWTLRSP